MTVEHSKPAPGNWKLSQRGQGKPYLLAIITLDNGFASLSKLIALGGGGLRATEFRFEMNPRNMELSEPMATVIRPTQAQGQFVESQGQIYKDIRIAGTTGLRPNPKISAIIDPAKGVPFGERTGFDDLIDLRNLFRTYAMAKVDPALAHLVVMVWLNGHEGDYYVVEPINFKTGRDSSSPLTATYDIQLKTISRYDSVIPVIDTHLKRKDVSKFRSILNRLTAATAGNIEDLTRLIDDATSTYARFLTDILEPANAMLSALKDLANTPNRILAVTSFALTTLATNLLDALRVVADTVTGRTLKSALHQLLRVVMKLQSIPELFFTSVNKDIVKKRGAYLGTNRSFGDSGGDLLDISNNKINGSLSTATIGPNDTIRKIAKRILGSAAKWKILAIANDLKAPYISVDGNGTDVLRPGDEMLFPSGSTAVQSPISRDRASAPQTPVEERLGRDIKLVKVSSAGGITQYDWAVDNNGAAETIQGLPNMEQGINLKFETEAGDLPMHPMYGIKFPIGVKAPSTSGFVAFNVEARSTLLSDTRVESVQNLQIGVDGNALKVDATVNIKGFDSPISFSFMTKK